MRCNAHVENQLFHRTSMRSTYYMFQNRHSITFIYLLVPCAASSLSLIHFKHEPWACCLKIRVAVHTIWPMLPPIAASARLSKPHLHGSPPKWESIVTKQLYNQNSLVAVADTQDIILTVTWIFYGDRVQGQPCSKLMGGK